MHASFDLACSDGVQARWRRRGEGYRLGTPDLARMKLAPAPPAPSKILLPAPGVWLSHRQRRRASERRRPSIQRAPLAQADLDRLTRRPVPKPASQAQKLGVRPLIFAHIGKPTIRAIDQGAEVPFGELGSDQRRYRV